RWFRMQRSPLDCSTARPAPSPMGLEKVPAVPLNNPAVNAASGTTDQVEPPLVETSRVPASKHWATLPSNRKVCQKESVELACGTKEGETSTRSAGVACSSEAHECVGVCDWVVVSVQSRVPLRMECAHPGLSKPPTPSKVSVSVPFEMGPVGVALFSTVLVSPTPFELSNARTT